MNRAARRAARFTKAGRRQHAIDTEHICEHGNWMKTDGNGDPMCPHRCGFRPGEPGYRAERGRQAVAFARSTRIRPTPGDPYPPTTAPPVA